MQKKEIRFSEEELAPNGAVRPSAVLRRLQEIAGEDSASFGMGYDALRAIGVVFVLYKLRYVASRPLCAEEDLTLTTHSRRVHGATFVRDFVIETASEGVIFTCESLWCLIDFETRALVRPSVLPLENMVFTEPESHPENARLSVPEGEAQRTSRRAVDPSLLDRNRHLNNCHYADFVLGVLPEDAPAVRDLQIDFKKEALCGDVLLLSRYDGEEGCTVAGRFEKNGEICFLSRVRFFGEEKNV